MRSCLPPAPHVGLARGISVVVLYPWFCDIRSLDSLIMDPIFGFGKADNKTHPPAFSSFSNSNKESPFSLPHIQIPPRCSSLVRQILRNYHFSQKKRGSKRSAHPEVFYSKNIWDIPKSVITQHIYLLTGNVRRCKQAYTQHGQQFWSVSIVQSWLHFHQNQPLWKPD